MTPWESRRLHTDSPRNGFQMRQWLLNAALLMSSNSVVLSYHHLTTGAQIRFSNIQRCSFSWCPSLPAGAQKVGKIQMLGGAPSVILNSSSKIGKLRTLVGSHFQERGFEMLCSLILERSSVPYGHYCKAAAPASTSLLVWKVTWTGRGTCKWVASEVSRSSFGLPAFPMTGHPLLGCDTDMWRGDTGKELSTLIGNGSGRRAPWMRCHPGWGCFQKTHHHWAPLGCKAPSLPSPAEEACPPGKRRPRTKEAAQGTWGSGGRAHRGMLSE